MKKSIITLTLLCIAFILSSCAHNYLNIKDVEMYPQYAVSYLDLDHKTARNKCISPEFHKILNDKYNERFFSPWEDDDPSFDQESVIWGFDRYSQNLGFGENKKPHDPKWIEELKDIADLKNYPNKNKRAITIANTSLRVLPTSKPHFYDFKKLGEGYPFDNLQNSSIAANTPIFISHISKDSSWVLAESPFALGWIPVSDIAYVDEAFINKWQTEHMIAVIDEKIPLYDKNNNFLLNVSIGHQFPVEYEPEVKINYGTMMTFVRNFIMYDFYDEPIFIFKYSELDKFVTRNLSILKKDYPKYFTIYLARDDLNQKAFIEKVKISKKSAIKKPFLITQNNVALLVDKLMNKPYGWGGMYFNRDCSAALRDLFTPFSLWLERNSTYQAKYGGVFIDLSTLSNKEKEEMIIKNAFPYLTLIWKRGHIMLYLGQQDGRPLIFHNVWGIRYKKILKKKELNVIGKSIISTLEPGKEYGGVKTLLKKMGGITLMIPSKKY